MLNRVVIMGRLTHDPVLRCTASGLSCVNFSVAVDRDFGRDDAGEKITDFLDCVAWRSTADFIAKYAARGRLVVVSGRLQIRNWTDKEGRVRRSSEIIVDSLNFADSRRDSANSASSQSPADYQMLEDDSLLPFA